MELAENVVTRMHAGFGNLPGSWSAVVIGGMVMEEKDGGRLVGGCQVLPEVGVIIRTSPGTVIFCQYDRWLHGNVPLATQGGNAFREAMILFLSENVVKYGKK